MTKFNVRPCAVWCKCTYATSDDCSNVALLLSLPKPYWSCVDNGHQHNQKHAHTQWLVWVQSERAIAATQRARVCVLAGLLDYTWIADVCVSSKLAALVCV